MGFDELFDKSIKKEKDVAEPQGKKDDDERSKLVQKIEKELQAKQDAAAKVAEERDPLAGDFHP